LITAATRVRHPQADVAGEGPVFIDSSTENPADYISFQNENCIAVDQNIRGSESIKILALNRSLLVQNRLELLNKLITMYQILNALPDDAEGIRTQVIGYIVSSKNKTTDPGHQ
jgi:hypothetical protein